MVLVKIRQAVKGPKLCNYGLNSTTYPKLSLFWEAPTNEGGRVATGTYLPPSHHGAAKLTYLDKIFLSLSLKFLRVRPS